MKTILITLALIVILAATAFHFRPGLYTDEEGTAKVLELKVYYERMAKQYPN